MPQHQTIHCDLYVFLLRARTKPQQLVGEQEREFECYYVVVDYDVRMVRSRIILLFILIFKIDCDWKRRMKRRQRVDND